MAAAGIGFAILVLFMQLGFYGSVVNTAVAVTSRLNADLVLVSPRFVHLSQSSTLPRTRIFQAFADPAVASGSPLYLRYVDWRDPSTGARCRLFALGFPLTDPTPIPIEGIDGVNGVAAQRDALRPLGSILLDRLTQSRCGPRDANGQVELRNESARVAGYFDLGVGFLGDGALLMSDDTFDHVFADSKLSHPQLGLLRLRPGADEDAVAKRLQQLLPPDTRVLTRSRLSALQVRHWVENTAIGNIFALGAIAGFFVGVAVLHEILSTDIRNHLPLYATLKAMGYSERRLYRFVLEEATFFALLGFAPAFALSLIAFPFIRALTRLPMFLTPGLTLFVFVASVAMCTAAALLSLRRISLADPAELF